MKDDEQQLLKAIYYMCHIHDKTPREVINCSENKVNYKRCYYLLNKWTEKDWYDYGVSIDLGWITDKGADIAKELLESEE